MCILIARPDPTKLIPKSVYENCFSNNRDGAGFAYIRNNEVFIAKGFFTFKDFWDNFEPLQEISPLVHFRIGTSGGNNAVNCHPWLVNDNLVFGHNGTIPIKRENQALSDTGNVNEIIFKPLMKRSPDFWKTESFKWMIEQAIGTHNKLVFLDNTGEIRIFNEKEGNWKYDSWFSNYTYNYCSTRYRGHYYDNDYMYGNYRSSTTPSTGLPQYTEAELSVIDEELEKAEELRISLMSC